MLLDRRFLDISLTVLGIANEPDSEVAAGDQYIVGSAGTGAFTGITPNSIARYDGTNWKFSAPKAGSLEVLNVNTGEILRYNVTDDVWNVIADFNSFIAPVLDIIASGTTLPATTPNGAYFLKTDENKLYTATDVDTWDSGTALSSGVRYASSTDHKVYESDGEELKAIDVPDGGMFLNKGDGNIYVYDQAANAFKRNGADVTLTETHVLTAAEATAKTFNLTNQVATGKENQVILFVNGVNQIAGSDFSVSGNTVSWTSKGLEDIGLAQNDVFTVHYITA